MPPQDGLAKLYLQDRLSINTIASEVHVDPSVIRRWMRDLDIPVRDPRETKIAEIEHWTEERWSKQRAAVAKAQSIVKGRSISAEVLHTRAVSKQRNAKLSAHEEIVLIALRDAGLDPIPLYAVGPHNIDFAFPDIKLAVEYNGGSWHNLPQVKANDQRKDALLQSQGWRVLWFPQLKELRSGGGKGIALADLVQQVLDAAENLRRSQRSRQEVRT